MPKPRLRTNKVRPAKAGSWCSVCLESLYFWEIQDAWNKDQDYVHGCGRVIPQYKEPGK